MRIRIGVLFALVASVFSFAPAVRAQFQDPTPDELKMSSDPKAPGAAAVYLYREETTDDTLHFHSMYVRLKILTEKGKELATVSVPYQGKDFKVTDVHGRTIHSDGTVIPLTAKPSDMTDVKTKDFQAKTVVFTLPDVEVGSILEYRLQERYADDTVSSPFWQVQQPYFVHKAHYMFRPTSGAFDISNSRGDNLNRIAWILHTASNTEKVIKQPRGDYTFDVTDVPAIPSEDWMPPLNSLTWMVRFYYTQYSSSAEFWQKEGKRWENKLEDFTHQSGTIRDAVNSLVATGDTDAVKARKIYEAVQKLENTRFTRVKSEAERKKENIKEIKSVEDVWKQKSGSANALALLYIALARAAGLKVYPLQVVNRDDAILDQTYLSTYQLDDYIAIVMIDGKEIYVDPGQKDCPFGLLHWTHAPSAGLRESEKGVIFDATPASNYKQNTITRVANLDIAADGSVTGTARIVLSGQDALRWRHIALRNDPEEVKKQFNEYVRGFVPDGVTAEFDHFLGADDYNSVLAGIVKITGTLGSSTGKHFFLPGLFFESHAKHPFVAEEKRETPIDVHFPTMTQDEVTYHLPEGFAVESAPAPTSVDWPQHAMLRIKFEPTKDTILATRALAYNYTILDSKFYGDLHGFYQKVATADQQQLVLTKAAAAKGN